MKMVIRVYNSVCCGLKMGIRAENRWQDLHLAEGSSAIPQGSALDCNPDRTLEEITRSAQHLTFASGAALALSDGSVISCRACSGFLAPPVGTQLNIDTGLTATCVQTAQVVRCDDSQADPRVDGSRCIGIRSILAVPIFDGPRVAGVLEVFSGKPNRFTDKHSKSLQLLARLVETHVNYVARGNAPSTPDPTPGRSDSAAAGAEAGRVVGCLSCGHWNPQDSQFCNRCGVILCVPSDPLDTTTAFSLSMTKSIDQDGLREIYNLISGTSGLATWNDIYAKFRTNLENPSSPRTKPTRPRKKRLKSENKTNIFHGRLQIH